jgi:hypothetical protein
MCSSLRLLLQPRQPCCLDLPNLARDEAQARLLHQLFPATMVPGPRRSPHSIFSLLLRWLAGILRAFIMALASFGPIPHPP